MDGRPEPIDYFTEIDKGRVRGSSDERIGEVPSLAPGEPVGTSYLIFIDELFAIRHHRDRVLNRLEKDLALLTPADRVAIVAFDGYEVVRLTDWTHSVDESAKAIERARHRKALGLMRMQDLGDRIDQTRRAVLAATATVRSFAAAPGRKIMLLLAETSCQPSRIWEVSPLWGEGTCRASVGNVYGPLVDAANLVGYTVYPVDLSGFRPEVGFDATNSYFNSEWLQETALRFLADETGGVAMINAYLDVAFAKAVSDTRSYYWLGFEPPHDGDDALHDIEVRVVNRRDLQVRFREHYRDMSRTSDLTMLVEGSLMFGGTLGKGVLGVHFGTPRRAGFRKILVPMWVTIPIDDLTLLPIDGQWKNEVEFRISVVDRYGDRSRNLGSRIPIVYAEAPPPGKTFIYETELPIHKREHRFLAAVYDPLTGEILSHRSTVGPR